MQERAVQELLHHESGILSAATAFGKTVVCCAMIAERKTSTLILLQSSSLIEQWNTALERFLSIEEALPTYQTKSGRTRKRKSLIGYLQGERDTTTGIIDIAMAGSVFGKHDFAGRLSSYGMVLVDECHHAASETMQRVLREVKAKYVYGVTATPIRIRHHSKKTFCTPKKKSSSAARVCAGGKSTNSCGASSPCRNAA